MPKIYGKVIASGTTLVCKQCGYRWEGNSDELNDISNNRQVTCLSCRAMNYIKVGQLIPKNTAYRLAQTVKVSDPNELRNDNYQDKQAEVIHMRCRHNFKAKLIDIRHGDLSCPFCKEAIKHSAVKGAPSIKPGTLIEVFTEQDKLEETGRIPTTNEDKKIGKILKTNTRIMEIDQKRDTYTSQCIMCGTEETRSLSLLKKASNKDKLLLCSRCSKQESSLEELKHKYLGKIFNGQQIDSIYQGKNGEILCNLVCMQNKRNIGLEDYIQIVNAKNDSLSTTTYIPPDILHTQLGVAIGDVINKRCYCKVCGTRKLPELIKRALSTSCKNMETMRKSGRIPKFNLESISIEDFYKDTRTKSLCDYCSVKSVCKAAGLDQRNSLAVVSTLLDIQDSLVGDMLDITVDYPGMFQFKESDGRNLDIIADKDLIVIKEAFAGSDGKMYRTCKCRKHGTEMTLTDSEIAEFNHEQCTNPNAYMKFFDMQNQYYLGAIAEKDKKK